MQGIVFGKSTKRNSNPTGRFDDITPYLYSTGVGLDNSAVNDGKLSHPEEVWFIPSFYSFLNDLWDEPLLSTHSANSFRTMVSHQSLLHTHNM